MDNSAIKASSNWTRIGGCTFSQSIERRAMDPDVFMKPHLNELVDEEKSILLSKQDSSEFCEFYLKIYPNYKIQAVSFVCNVDKVEIFQGPINEYLETIYGVLLDEPDDQFESYRYDAGIEKSGITDLALRFLTNSSDVCIFGLMLHISPNPNGVATLLSFSGCINGQNILENSTRKSGSVPDKCKQLLELLTKSNQCNSSKLGQHKKQKTNISIGECSATARETNEEIFDSLKCYIDERFKEIEMQINRYLEGMERQTKKLDKILNILEKQK